MTSNNKPLRMPFMFTTLRNYVALIVAVAALFQGQSNADATEQIDGDRLLAPDRIVEIKIELPPDDWTKLCRQARNPTTAFSGLPNESPYTYFKGDLWIDGVKIESVGIRKKGFLGSADTQRPSLKIKFDEYEKQDPIKGLGRLTLNNNKQDRSQLSQYLTYRLFRDAGNPAPRSNWAHVIVNGESLGVYSNVESIKKPFLSRNFGDKTGNLYEGTLTDFHPDALDNIEVKTNDDENDLSDIRQLATLLAKEGELDLDEVAQLIDLDSFLRHWALEGLTGFWDGYSANQNNFYMYFNPKDQGRGVFIPWGADWVITNSSPFSRGRFGAGNAETTVIYAQGILANRLYRTKGIPERYRETMQRLLNEVWDEEEMLTEIDRAEKLVSPHLHQAQAETPQALNELRRFIRGRRSDVEQALKEWRPTVPQEPRTPAHVVDVGKASGSFTTVFGATDSSAENDAEMKIELDDKPITFDKLTVSARPFQMPRFGGFGGPPGGGGGRGATPAPPPPVQLTVTGERSGEQPITVSLIIDREQFKATTDKSLRVTGSYQEGRGGGFGGFGGGPSRSIVGELRLSDAGTEPGKNVAGSFNLRIVETRGGMFQRPGRGGPPRSFGAAQPLTLQRALDTDRDGSISAKEIEQAASVLKRLDRNRDGKLSADELQTSPRGQRPFGRPPGQRPQAEDE